MESAPTAAPAREFWSAFHPLDSQRFVERAVAAGVDVRLVVWEGMPHGFVGGVGQIEAAADALVATGEFLRSRFAPKT